VREAIRAHESRLERVIVEAAGSEPSPQLEALARFARDHGAQVDREPRTELDRMAHGARHQGAIALAPDLEILPLNRIQLGEDALVVALDEVQDPQNFGAIIRSAVAMGATAVVWPEHRSAPLSPATFRASAGAVEHAKLCRVAALPSALAALQSRGMAVVGLDMTADGPIDEVDLSGSVVLVVGAEGRGLRRTVKHACASLARLRMPGPIDSLNVAAAVAIALHEAVRQRQVRSTVKPRCSP
jgi:23S rRNA (guanosine2251-2'-O)-methyltransferase